ncbi:DUF6470 family protein [Fictibacillus aquaticus]|uniref:Uncharacterized protein n=1 Tax=Fictibacillus aquaticus TaxID=2021314 RepID=A0A235FFL0_9BACL|nr:DUF6470 family protein [Fictibacillus aquaticus]OYD59744.1 hypothetical protein CGZ90_07645 [Fictibacillus aquaticus]
MNSVTLKIQSTPGLIELSREKPVQEIHQPAAEMTIIQKPAELTMERTPGKLSIDQTKAREDMDLKSVFKRTEEAAQNGYNDWLAGMARLSQQGDELMRIENGGNPLAFQVAENSASPQYDFNIGFIPSHFSVKINYQPSILQINWKTNLPEINITANEPEHTYTPGSVSVSMKQWPSLTIEVLGLEIDEKK